MPTVPCPTKGCPGRQAFHWDGDEDFFHESEDFDDYESDSIDEGRWGELFGHGTAYLN
jgi:hypothetical protein